MTKYAKTYGDALFELASDEKIEDAVKQDLASICGVIKENPEYRKLLTSPAISKEERKQLLKEAWEGNINPYTLNFLCILCDQEALSQLEGCVEEFIKRYNDLKGIVEADVISAVKLSEGQRKDLLKAIEKKTGKTIILNEKVDPSIMGGLKLQLAGKQYDDSVAYHLGSIAQLISK